MEAGLSSFANERFARITGGMTPSARLKQARQAAGYRSASSAAKTIGIGVSTYLAHENGQNAFNTGQANRYAKAFSVSPAWLLIGEGNGLHLNGQVAAGSAQALIQGMPGIEDPDAYIKAYEIARTAEQSALDGRGDKDVFAEAVNVIYKMIRAGKDGPASGNN